MVTRHLAPFASIAAAVIWMVGLCVVALAGVIPSDAPYFFAGILSLALGVFLIPVGLALPSRASVKGIGLVLCAAMALTGLLLVFGASGKLGATAPSWITPASEAPLVALVAWILLASFLTRSDSRLGAVVFGLVLLNVAVLIAVIETTVRPYTHTNDTELIDGVLVLLAWTAFPAWLVAVAVRMWSHSR